jgi:hypothetical protein
MSQRDTLNVLVMIGATLSTLGCLSVVASYIVFKKLRNLFYRITIYHAVVEAVQALGLVASIVAR